MKKKLVERYIEALCLAAGALLGGAYILGGIGAFKSLPKDIAHTSDIASAVSTALNQAGNTDYLTQCRSAISIAVQNSGGNAPSFGKVEVRNNGQVKDVYVYITSFVYTGWSKCEARKSVWQVLGNSPSGPPPKLETPSS